MIGPDAMPNVAQVVNYGPLVDGAVSEFVGNPVSANTSPVYRKGGVASFSYRARPEPATGHRLIGVVAQSRCWILAS